MKRILYILFAAVTISSLLFSCDAVEDRETLPAVTLTPSTLKFSVTQNPTNKNQIVLKNDDPTVVPYWKYVDASGNELGHSNKSSDNVVFPFAGKYTVYFTAYTRGGSVEAAPVSITVTENDVTYFKDPKWNMLTNGVAGKTWILDMASPVGWAGLDYPAATGDNWSWLPDYAGNSWVMANKNWGEMYFDLNGGYNTSVTQTAISSEAQTTKKGTYGLDLVNSKITFNGGPEMLYGGDYYGDCSNWITVKVVELTATSLRLAVIRDKSRTGEGVCLIVFHYKPKS
ncbi:hypothetical protein EYY60_07080 [Flavobacterium zhairuonense]|uniref:hypothetical protein n=1 Tax=Flavobacterium zhairuonense TaxID=2493631 RepID=UPI0010488ABF|nr:hypothetical protein [Flavobacterium zhairuonense]KAF2512003.1 hypothetical protein EYY60_07080 [Flavobacterium zhairuonense]